jgi:DNA-binding CsgD family transcriptional regulator
MRVKLDQGSVTVAGEDLVGSTRIPLDCGTVAVAGDDLIARLLDEVLQHLSAALVARCADPNGSSWLEHWARAAPLLTKRRRAGAPPKAAGQHRYEQVARYFDDHHTVEETAARFGIKVETVEKYHRRAHGKLK